jgi:hypothetical protein
MGMQSFVEEVGEGVVTAIVRASGRERDVQMREVREEGIVRRRPPPLDEIGCMRSAAGRTLARPRLC